MIELIERIEVAKGSDRELDAEIAHRVGHPGNYRVEFMGWDVVGHTIYRPGPLRYTASIDAAMTLVPEGWCLRGLNETSDGKRADNPSEQALPNWSAAMIPHSLTGYANRKKVYGGWVYGDGATPALALCAAALRARSIDG